jgi:hypothetical protein
MNKVLVQLLCARIVRLGENSWRWAEKNPSNPSLNNSVTSRMFRLGLVEVVGAEMKLTTVGRIQAEQLIGVEK